MARRLLLFGFLTVSVCSGFNIDERFPVIKEGKTKGSFFGLSVALHKQTKGSKYLLLVGAPKEKALSLTNVNETGAVYSCPVSTETSDCTMVDLIQPPEPSSEMVEGMWLGVTVASQRDSPEGRVMACGHRYVKLIDGGTEKQRRMVGKCYIVSNDLMVDPSDIWQDDEPRVCNPNEDFEMEGMCNMGISGGMTDTDIYMGTPGSYLWQGNVLVTWRDPDPERESWNVNNRDFGRLGKRDNYMGYAVVEAKKLLIRDEYTVVTGSPRDESKGSVTLGRQEGTSLIEALVIPGEQVGSYFGSSLAVTDLNSDDWNDLIVGAPFYFLRSTDRSTDEGGAVYIFMNENGSFQKTPTMVLKGPGASGFGLALAAIGDVNQDGFQDFAVGAPFHDTGKVYIWTGSRKGISEEPSQVIEGKSVGNGGFQTFGYSINGGIDMDGNSYPDILVGSLDDRIALLRARPVVHLFKNFTVQPLIVDVNQCTPDKPACISATVCFNYTLSNGNKDFKKDITVKYTVEIEKDRRKSPRILFAKNKDDSFTSTLNLPSHKPKCAELWLTVAPNVKDKLEPVVFSLNVSLQEQKPKSRRALQNLDSFPSLSQKQKLTERTEINFLRECGLDNKCTSNLQLTAEYASAEGDVYPRQDKRQVLHYDSNVKKIMLKVKVTNYPAPGKLAEDAHQAVLDVTIPDTLRYSGVRSEDPNDVIECNNQDTLTCELGNPLKGKEKVALQLIFETTEINLDTEEIVSQLLLSTLSEQSDLVAVPVTLLIENTILTTFSIDKPLLQRSFSGEVKGESAMSNSSDVGSLVEYTFSVAVSGSPLGNMGTLAVEFAWPFEVTNGKWLLYLTEIVFKGTSETHCVPGDDVVNPLNLTLPEGKHKRPKRQISLDDGDSNVQPHILEPQAAITLQTNRKESYLLDCSLGTARCVTFTCPLLNMNTSAKVIVRSRIWTSTMLEDYANAARVQVNGQATLKLITDKPTIKMDSVTREFKVNIDPVLGEETPYEVPLWIVIIAAVAGIILLGVISLVLWKLGFFKRTIYYRIMPKHKGVRIRKAERYQFNLGFQLEEPQKKYWITNWTEMQHYY